LVLKLFSKRILFRHSCLRE